MNGGLPLKTSNFFVTRKSRHRCYKEFNNNTWKTIHNYTDSAHSRGVAIMFNSKLEYEIIDIHKKNDSRVLLINAKINGIDTTLCNVYAPNKKNERAEFFKTLKLWVARHALFENEIIMAGDFNCAKNNNDRKNKKK